MCNAHGRASWRARVLWYMEVGGVAECYTKKE